MKKLILTTCAAVSCLLGSSAAMAAYVTDYQNGVLLGSFTLSLTPTVLSFVPGHSTTVVISNGTGDAFGYTSATFYKAIAHGGLLVGDPATTQINTSGAVLYSFKSSAPVFTPGTYFEKFNQIITISAFGPGVPEPATWAMMLLGFGMIGFAARRRQNVAVSYS